MSTSNSISSRVGSTSTISSPASRPRRTRRSNASPPGSVPGWNSREDLVKYPANPFTPLPRSEWTVERMRKVKYALAGTVGQVKHEIEALHKIGGHGELEWFGWFFDQGFHATRRREAPNGAL